MKKILLTSLVLCTSVFVNDSFAGKGEKDTFEEKKKQARLKRMNKNKGKCEVIEETNENLKKVNKDLKNLDDAQGHINTLNEFKKIAEIINTPEINKIMKKVPDLQKKLDKNKEELELKRDLLDVKKDLLTLEKNMIEYNDNQNKKN